MITQKLVYMKHTRGTPAPQIPKKALPYVELTIVIKGTLVYYIDRQRYVLNEGDAVFIRQGEEREREEGTEENDYVSFNFLLDEEPDLPTYLPNILTGDIRLLIAACDEIRQTQISSYEETISYLLPCLLVSVRNSLQRQSTHPLVEKIVRYIHENISGKITLSDISEHTYFSSIYCDAVFKRETGRSIVDYLLEERVNLAKQLLTEGAYTLQQVAEATGFSDRNYFSRTFKKRTGYTPGQYRKMIGKALS